MGNRRMGARRMNALQSNKLAQDNGNETAAAMKDAVVSNTVTQRGTEVVTEICVDLGTSKASVASSQNQADEGDVNYQQIIGISGSGPGSHGASYLTRLTPAVNGYITAAEMICTELPVGGELDIDLWTSDIATGSYSGSALGMTNGASLIAPTQDWSLGAIDHSTVVHGTILDDGLDDKYVYLVNGATSANSTANASNTNHAAVYTSGKFAIRFYGVKDFDDK